MDFESSPFDFSKAQNYRTPAMGWPIAFLLTFRPYGTWLHGDERGSVDDANNSYGLPLIPGDVKRHLDASRRMRQPPVTFSGQMRQVIERVMRDHCEFRGWSLLEISVRTNHVHVLIGSAELKPEVMAGQLKARATRILRERGLVGPKMRIWADRAGSTKYIWRQSELNSAARYISEGQNARR